MKREKFCELLGEINEDYVKEAETIKKAKKPVWVKWGAMAACLCLIIVGAVVAPNLNDGAKDYAEVIVYNNAEYMICGSGESAILEKCGLPVTITEDLAGEFLGNLSQSGKDDFHYAIGGLEDGDMKIYEYAPEPNDNVYILSKDGEYYAAIRRDSNGYYGLPSTSEGDEFRYPIQFEPNEANNEYRYPLGYEATTDEFRYPIKFVPNEDAE